MTVGLQYEALDDSSNVLRRRMHGSERMTAAIAEHADGFGHIFDGIHVIFKDDITQQKLLESMKTAWIRTRFMAPWVAVRSAKLDNEEPNSWVQTYTTPLTDSAVVAWADETVSWKDEVKSMPEWEEYFSQNFWTPSDGRYGMEYHLAKAPQEGYFILITVCHWMGDGRGLLPHIDLFFRHLRCVLSGNPSSVMNYHWGEEVKLLSPAIIKAITAELKAEPGQGASDKRSLKATDSNAVHLQHKQFLRPVIEFKQWQGSPIRKADISLSQMETAAFHRSCRNHDVHVTAVLNSIHILADVETAICVAYRSKDPEKVMNDFYTSDVYPVYTNVADRRSCLSQDLPCVTGPAGFGNVVNENFTTFHDMLFIRGCIDVDMDGTVCVKLGQDAFWNGLATETQMLMKSHIKTTPLEFHTMQNMIDLAVLSFDPTSVSLPGIMCSSIGNLASLKFFDTFRPDIAGPNPRSPFIFRDMTFAVRCPSWVTAVVTMMWEYDGKLKIHLQGSPKWHDEFAWSTFVESIYVSINQILEYDATANCKL